MIEALVARRQPIDLGGQNLPLAFKAGALGVDPRIVGAQDGGLRLRRQDHRLQRLGIVGQVVR